MRLRRRQSARLQQQLQARHLSNGNDEQTAATNNRLRSKKQGLKSAVLPHKRLKTRPTKATTTTTTRSCCPLRTRESELMNGKDDNDDSTTICYDAVMSIDEAGRGPLAGPVVAAAAIVPSTLDGIMDSKLLKKQEERERIYQELVESPHVQWAVAVIDAARIDEINILQSTMEGMRMAASAVMDPSKHCDNGQVCVTREGCYVVCSSTEANHHDGPQSDKRYYALIDGNRLSEDMPCEAEAIVKGDSKEYCIAAASILAKVTRDRLMTDYDKLYPHFELERHKGYPTAAHMDLVKKHGASPIHRRTFAPLKHMSFDEQGRVIS